MPERSKKAQRQQREGRYHHVDDEHEDLIAGDETKPLQRAAYWRPLLGGSWVDLSTYSYP